MLVKKHPGAGAGVGGGGGGFLPVNLLVEFVGPQALNLIPWVEEKSSLPPGELYQLLLKWPRCLHAVP